MPKQVKSYFVSVVDEKHKTIERKQLFYVKEANALYLEWKEKHKDNPNLQILKEYY